MSSSRQALGVTHWPLFGLAHPFDALKRSASGAKGLKAQQGSRDSFDRSVILSDPIVEVLPLPNLDFGNSRGVTNISAKLSLVESKVRKTASLDDDALIDIPNSKLTTTSIATSNAQNDSGLFELNFRYERYLPFEGAGAISKWRLELLSKMRLFDYNTIADVIVHISYTAKDNDVLKDNIDMQIAGKLSEFADENGLCRLPKYGTKISKPTGDAEISRRG